MYVLSAYNLTKGSTLNISNQIPTTMEEHTNIRRETKRKPEEKKEFNFRVNELSVPDVGRIERVF